MTATDKLRRMLDERGVEWCDSSDENVLHTTWNDMDCWFNEFPDGWTAWGMAKRGTPEQAIAATLGAGTCHNVSYRLDESRFHCSECERGGWWEDVADGRDKVPRYCPNCGRKVVHGGS